MPRKKTEKKKPVKMVQRSLLDLLADDSSSAARDTVRGMLACRDRKGIGEWRGLLAVPPGTLAEEIISAFHVGSDIPLEIPFFTMLHWLAGHLLKNDVSLLLPDGVTPVRTDLWTVLLASSGAGKTFVETHMRAAIGKAETKRIESPLTGIASGAAFVDELARHNKGLWNRDEFGQFLKQISKAGGNLEEVKDILLRLHDSRPIERKTKKYEIVIDDPALAILGLSVAETFADQVSPNDMVDGFAQRFGFIIAQKDPDRPMKDYPLYQIRSAGWAEKWKALTASIAHEQYTATPEAIEGYKTAFTALIPTSHIPPSFYRRILWRAHKYALVFHILTGRGHEKNLDAQDYGWAARAASLHIHDAISLLSSHGMGDLERLIQRVEELKLEAAKTGEQLTPRTVIRRISAVKTAAQARELLLLAE